MADITIETSTDTAEQVAEALGATIEIDESPAADETEEKEKPPAKAPKAKEEPKPDDEPAADENENEEEGTEEAVADKEKPVKKVIPTVPRARLNEVIRERDRLKRQLAEKSDEPDEDEPVADTAPKRFSGRPEPQIEDFTKDVDPFDPQAMAKANANYLKALAEDTRIEARAEIQYQDQVAKANAAHEKLIAPFKARIPATLARRPDYNDVMDEKAADVFLHNNIRDYVYDSEIGPDILLHFVENPDEAKRISELGGRSQSLAMIELEKALKAEIDGEAGEETGEEVLPKKPLVPLKKAISKTPIPAARLKPAGPGPKTEAELAGPADKVGIDIEFNPEYERTVKARRKT